MAYQDERNSMRREIESLATENARLRAELAEAERAKVEEAMQVISDFGQLGDLMDKNADLRSRVAELEKGVAGAKWARQNIRDFWSFSGRQIHTHSYHGREDFLVEWDRRAGHFAKETPDA